MKINFSKRFQIYIFSLLTLSLFFIGFIITFFMNSSGLDGDKVTSLYEVTTFFETLTEQKEIEALRIRVAEDEKRKVIVDLSKMEDEIIKINSQYPDETFKDVEKHITLTREGLESLVKHPTLASLVKVFEDKIVKFNYFVKSNNWPTLTRMSSRVRAQVAKSRPNYFYLKKLFRRVRKNLKTMENVTTSSILTTSDKNLILARLRSIDTEVRMLNKQLSSMDEFFQYHALFKTAFEVWYKRISPQIALEKIELAKHSKTVVYLLLGLFFFVLGGIIFGFFVMKNSLKSNINSHEESVLDIVKQYLVLPNPNDGPKGSEHFLSGLNKAHDYIQKRMNFGQIFQSALPFGSVLLDEQLKVEWANSQLCDIWKLEQFDTNKDTLTWDYLARFTNLGEQSPIIDAIKSNISGIYQIQIKADHNSNAIPYEMYVNPIDHLGKKRLMLFFYPLTALEQTLSEQSKTLISPIKKTIQALKDNNFNHKFKENIQLDYEIAGLQEIYQEFLFLNDKSDVEKQTLLEELNLLESELHDYHKLFVDIQSFNEEAIGYQIELANHFKSLRKSIVNSVENISKTDSINKTLLDLTDKTSLENKRSLNLCKQLQEKLNKNKESLTKLQALRKGFKELKTNLGQLRGRIIQAMDQVMAFQKSGMNDPNRIQQGFDRVKQEGLLIEKVLAQFDKMLTQYDVQISKNQLLIDEDSERYSDENLGAMKQGQKELSHRMQILKDNYHDLSVVTKKNEDNLVGDIKGMFEKMAFGNERSRIISKLTAQKFKNIQSNLAEMSESNNDEMEEIAAAENQVSKQSPEITV